MVGLEELRALSTSPPVRLSLKGGLPELSVPCRRTSRRELAIDHNSQSGQDKDGEESSQPNEEGSRSRSFTSDGKLGTILGGTTNPNIFQYQSKEGRGRADEVSAADESSGSDDKDYRDQNNSNEVDKSPARIAATASWQGRLMDDEAEEEARAAERLCAADARESARALAFYQQKALYDAVVDFRIRLEPILSIARAFPFEPYSFQTKTNSGSAPPGPSSVSAVALKSLASLAYSLEEASSLFSDSAACSLDWERNRLDSAAAAMASPAATSFKAIDTRPSAQVARSLATGKHLARVRRLRAPITLHDGQTFGEGSLNPATAAHYDDGDLYRALLREVVEAGDGSSNTGGSSLRYAQLARSGRVRKAIDRKANKGRRLRYVEHPKIVGFLAPIPLRDPGPVDEILSSLFGGGTEV